MNQFHSNKIFFNWFFSIFKNETISFLRKKSTIDKFEINESSNSIEDENVINLQKTLDNTSISFLEKQNEINSYKELIEELFDRLSTKHRNILELVFIDGKSYKEVSSLLKLPIGSVMSRIFYAKLESKKILQELNYEKDLCFKTEKTK